MSRNTIIVLIYHHYKLLDLIKNIVVVQYFYGEQKCKVYLTYLEDKCWNSRRNFVMWYKDLKIFWSISKSPTFSFS
jgi:hypothetical protein